MAKRHMAPSRKQRPPIRMALCAPFWGIALVLSGCQLVYGEYQAGHGTGGSAGAVQGGGQATGGAASIGGTTSQGGSEPGGSAPTGGSAPCDGTSPYRCVNGVLQACTSGAWTTKQTCTDPALCQPALGVCDVCATGEWTCVDSVLSFCNADHTAFTPGPTCSPPLYCDLTANHCVACATGEARCNGDDLAVCTLDRSDWGAQSCQGLGCHVFDGMTDYCNVCTAANPPVCQTTPTGAQLRSCVSGLWRTTTCANGCADATPTNPAACY
jgi:hypothetical protein